MIHPPQPVQLLQIQIVEVLRIKTNMRTNLTETMWEKTEETLSIKKMLFNQKKKDQKKKNKN